jgi:TPR repeat protein
MHKNSHRFRAYGLAQDGAKTVSLYRQACEMGLESACAVSNSNE